MATRRQQARAKLNLSLRVLAREASGFHQIETLFCALELADDVHIETTASGITLAVSHDAAFSPDDLGPPERNLAVRAAEAFLAAGAIRAGVRIAITKRIPAGAGLGGGSSDAAAVLRALHAAHRDALTMSELLEVGATIGSDVPFFLSGAPLALAWGRGGRMMPLSSLPPVHAVLVVPPERVSTAAAYGACSPGPVRPAILTPPSSWDDVAAGSGNDFEEHVFSQHPRLRRVRDELEQSGAFMSRMTGSGSVLFGLFDESADATRASDEVRALHPDVVTIMTRTAGGSGE